ncbi:MarR family winged helix-turn-helix transcriptional regulator [Parvibaculum sp.]|uniref:MarR family winged helix-turn-helix transcriptional regulator n=1 Tax=Parvibaculum sp. TaxID=2024848 RepID=UPI002BFB3CAD|nr:MarR family winged helix-turn-helix transcriptional regulator [Parvibaculum sp.]HUD52636.1 MarR family winged helix-turn-helix transcriptional regulator [Parvibaculum sp.]
MARQKKDARSIPAALPPEDSPENRLSPQYFLNLISEVGTLLAKIYDRRSGLSRSQTRIITSLLQRDGQTQTDLANELNIHKVSIGIYLNELEAIGLVERRSHPTDRRAKCIFLTPLLHAHKHLGLAHYADIHNDAIKGIGKTDYMTMLDCIALMRSNLIALDGKDRMTEPDSQGVPSARP